MIKKLCLECGKILETTLIELGITYKKQKWIKQITNVDFYIEPKIALYVDGGTTGIINQK